MKHWITILLAGAMTLSLAACGNPAGTAESTAASPSDGPAAESQAQPAESAAPQETANPAVPSAEAGTPGGQGGKPNGNFGGKPGNFGGQGGGFGGGGAVDKSGDAELQSLISTYLDAFEQYDYTDSKTGLSATYNLYLPEGYSETDAYPLVVFIPDSSVVGQDATAALTQGCGGLVWVTEEFQAEHPCIVLVPQYSETVLDDHNGYTRTGYVEMTRNLIHDIAATYAVDTDRIYGTGQSMGCMITLILSTEYPDLYAACMFVDGQWDITTLEGLKDQTFLYFAAEGDAKAYAGQQEVIEMLKKSGVIPATATWDATWSEEEIAAAAEELFGQGSDINCITWAKGTVLPDGAIEGTDEHMYSFDHAYKVDTALEWVFSHTN